MVVKMAANSRGGRDNTVESLSWSLPVQGLAGAAVELPSDLVEVGLGVPGEVGPLGQVLAHEAVPVLVGAALPGRVGVAEVDGDPSRDAEACMGGHLAPLVPGQ